jgi:hypothetical protein
LRVRVPLLRNPESLCRSRSTRSGRCSGVTHRGPAATSTDVLHFGSPTRFRPRRVWNRRGRGLRISSRAIACGLVFVAGFVDASSTATAQEHADQGECPARQKTTLSGWRWIGRPGWPDSPRSMGRTPRASPTRPRGRWFANRDHRPTHDRTSVRAVGNAAAVTRGRETGRELGNRVCSEVGRLVGNSGTEFAPRSGDLRDGLGKRPPEGGNR